MSIIKKIIIVGGGSAGWMSAAYLNKELTARHGDIEIILVESADIESVGVGEATVPTIRDFFSNIGVDENELIRKTDATIKLAIKFENWLTIKDDGYFHPFEAPLYSDGVEVASHWASLKKKNKHPLESFAHSTGVIPSLCDVNKIPLKNDKNSYQANTLYAYHLDAVLMAKYLRELSISRGVKRIEDNIKDVLYDSEGNITSVVAEQSGDLEADFYIDCTGFRSVLSEKALGDKFVSFEDELLCNSALAAPTKYKHEDMEVKPYTTAKALSSGWMWNIGLQSRIGNGYVFSDRFQSFDEAEVEFRKELNDYSGDLDIKKIKMKIGRRSKFWNKNCLAVGLSAGFVEPIESTGLQLIQIALEMFVDYFPISTNHEPLREKYNEVTIAKYEDLKDFIVTHYCLTERDDTPFWRHVKKDLVLSDSLKKQLEVWKYKLPGHSDLKEIGLFGAPNYMYILAGMNSLVYKTTNGLDNIMTSRSESILKRMKNFRSGAKQVSDSHRKYLRSIYK